jgi:AraC-like DNA-binding protein
MSAHASAPSESRIAASKPFWHQFAIRRIEDLANAVFGADLRAMQLAGPAPRGSLAFAAHRGVVFSTGLIDANVALSGPLSRDAITLGIGLHFGPKSRVCLNTVRDGDVGVVLPGDSHEVSLTSGSLYITATLTARQLEDEVSRAGLAFNRSMTLRTGLHPKPIERSLLVVLTGEVARIHRIQSAPSTEFARTADEVLRLIIEHYARAPLKESTRARAAGRALIVSRARDYIQEHLESEFTLEAIARAAGASRRTLARAFFELLDETPWNYVSRARLHRIRQELISDGEAPSAISVIARKWGVPTPEQLERSYRDLFGEPPSATRAAALARQQLSNNLL